MAESSRIEELTRRVQQDPASIAFAALAEEYRRAGRYDEAITTCRAGLQRHPSYISAHVTLGRALLEVGEFEQAREELELVLRVAPENLAAIRGLAEIHHRRGEVTEAHEVAEAHEAERSAAPGGEPVAAPARLEPEAAAPLTPALPAPVGYDVQPTTAPEPFLAESAIPILLEQPPPSEDPALAGLEEFLDAIIRVRRAAGGIHIA
jgi:tetratricopeptide (TPR) repeat protein